jgi:hypothetical protein
MQLVVRWLQSLLTWVSLGALLGVGCGSVAPYGTASFAYFEISPRDDPWRGKIEGWQSRERVNPVADPRTTAPGAVAERGKASRPTGPPPNKLQAKYEVFRSEQRRTLARHVAEWIQGQAKEHYVPDGPLDHWATLHETLERNGDDCDGLELLAFHLLRDLGFERDEVYRSIVHRPSDGQHHMVTLWFEDPDDPWVIDPTGAMTSGMPRMSEVPGWVPLKVFTDSREYTVRVAPSDAASQGDPSASR